MLQPPKEGALPMNLLHVIHVLLVLGEAKTTPSLDLLAVFLIIQPKMLLAVFAVMASLQHA